MLFKLIKFLFVGFSGLFIDFGLTFLCKEKLSYHICYKETDIEQGSYIPVKINKKKLKLFRKNE